MRDKSKFSQPEEMDLWVLISKVRKQLLTVSDRELRKSDISTVQLGILHALYNASEAGITPNLSDLARWIMRQHNTVSVMLTGMEKRGLVQLERNPAKKKGLKITITDKGSKLYEEMMEKRKAVPAIIGSLTVRERKQLKSLLEKLDEKSRLIL